MAYTRTSGSLKNVLVFDAVGNTIIPKGIRALGLQTAGFVKTTADGTFYIDTSGGGSGGGHIIYNSAGTAVTQQPGLKFVRLTVTNDGTNSLTVISRPADTYVGVSAPSSPEIGDVWTNSETWSTYKYYDGFWVEISNINPSGVAGTGTTNELAYFSGTSTLSSLTTGTYPSLTELSYVKGVTSAIQTQLNGKQATLTNPVTGTGTTNYLPKFTGTSTIGNSLVYDDGTNIGISNTTPNEKLHIVGGNGILTTNAGGDTRIAAGGLGLQMHGNSPTILYKNKSASANNTIWTGFETSTTELFGRVLNDAITSSQYWIRVKRSGATVSNVIFENGNTLIGTTTDSGFKLDVNGTARIQDNLTISDAKNIILDTTTGTKIGTATTQKIGFFNATPVVQPSAVTTSQGIADALSSLGLLASSSITTTPDVGGKLYLFNSY